MEATERMLLISCTHPAGFAWDFFDPRGGVLYVNLEINRGACKLTRTLSCQTIKNKNKLYNNIKALLCKCTHLFG